MRYGVAISALLHGVIVVLIVVGLPSILQSETRRTSDCRRNRDTRCASQEARAQENGSTQARAKETTATQARAAQGCRETDPASTRTRPAAGARTGARNQGRAVSAQTKAQGQTGAPKTQTETQRGKGRVEDATGAETQTETETATGRIPVTAKEPCQGAETAQIGSTGKTAKDRQTCAGKTAIATGTSPIAGGLVQAIKQQITPCWKIQAGAKDAVKMQVAIRMRLNPDGSLGAVPQIQDQGRIGRDPFSKRSQKVRCARCAIRRVCADQAALRTLRHLERNRVYL